MEFHNTGYGRDFFGHQLPELINALKALKPQEPQATPAPLSELSVAPQTFRAVIGTDSDYPSIFTEINGNLAVSVEQCLGDGTGRTMVRLYSKDNDECLSMNWHTGEIILPASWEGVVKYE